MDCTVLFAILSRLEVVEKAGHWVHAEQTATFVRLVSEFLSE
jgi:pimeloyl-ACP methyl ester carboxylesterase